MASSLTYAAPRVGKVDATFLLAIDTDSEWTSLATRHRIDAYRNTFAGAYRRWPDPSFADASSFPHEEH